LLSVPAMAVKRRVRHSAGLDQGRSDADGRPLAGLAFCRFV
jgi:hypothetical protein